MDDLDKSLYTVQNLTKDNLKEFSLSRAKFWSRFLNNLEKTENFGRNNSEKDNSDEALALNKMNDYYTADDEEQEPESEGCPDESIEHSSEDDNSFVNISVIEEKVTISNTKNILAVIAQNPNTTGIINEDREFLEKTLPIFEIYKREVKEDGFEKLLNSFDERKIEKDVGKMLCPRIQQSISPYNGDLKFQRSNYGTRRLGDADDDTDSDSIDEARYIRSTKKYRANHQRYEVTKIIKSFCSIKSKRDKLHEKSMQNKTMKELRRGATHHYPNKVSNCQSWAGVQSCHYHSMNERHIGRTCCDSSLSSCLDENEFEECLQQNERNYTVTKRTMPCQCLRCRSYNNSRQKLHHSYKRGLHNSRCCHNEMLPVVREADCCCRGVNKLCNRVRHLANSSSDDWLVENYESPEPVKKTKVAAKKSEKRMQDRKIHKNLKLSKIKDTIEEEATTSESDQMIEQKSQSLKKNEKSNVQVDNLSKKITKSTKTAAPKKPKTSKSKSTKDEPTNTADTNTDRDDSFEKELELAIKASKDLYKEELKKRLAKQPEPKKNDTSEHIKKIEPRKTVKKNVSFQNDVDAMRSKKHATHNKHKQQFVPQLTDISSESESKENTRKDNFKKKVNKQLSDKDISGSQHVKPLYSLNFEENKNAKHDKDTLARNPKTPNAEQNRKKVTKIKYQESSNSADSDESVRPKYNKHSSSQAAYCDNAPPAVNSETLESTENSTCGNLKMRDLHICNDTSSSDSAKANETVKMEITTTNATITENTTFFSNPGRICNSTALNVSPEVKARQLRLTKKTKACSTTTTKTDTSNRNELPSTSNGARNVNARLQALQNDLLSPTDSSDCKQVSSTTGIEKTAQKVSKPQQKPPKQKRPHIVLYSPNDTTLVPESSFVNDKYRLTVEHLGSIIGKKYAEVFFRYYRGKREFKLSSTVHYIPPQRGYYSGDDTSEDEIDMLDAPDVGRIVEERNDFETKG